MNDLLNLVMTLEQIYETKFLKILFHDNRAHVMIQKNNNLIPQLFLNILCQNAWLIFEYFRNPAEKQKSDTKLQTEKNCLPRLSCQLHFNLYLKICVLPFDFIASNNVTPVLLFLKYLVNVKITCFVYKIYFSSFFVVKYLR